MKKSILMLLVLCGSLKVGAQVIWSDTFEDTGAPSSGTRTPSLNTGGPSSPFTYYFIRTDGTNLSLQSPQSPYEILTSYQGFSGKFWAGEDIDRVKTGSNDLAEKEQTIVWSGISIAGKSNLSFKGLFAAYNTPGWQNKLFTPIENIDFLIVEYNIDGAGWQLLGAIHPDASAPGGLSGQLREDTNNDGLGDGTLLSRNATEFTWGIAGTGTNMSLRIRVRADAGGTQEFAFDNFRIFGSTANMAPTASNVVNTGTLKEGQVLTGSYSYSDPENNTENGSSFKWYRSNNASGLNKAVIPLATSNTYTLVAADVNKYISFQVIPRDGSLNGTAVESPLRGPVVPLVLPVELIGFTAKIEDHVVQLDWRTASETNNKGFAVFRRGETGNWKEIGNVVGKGNNSMGAVYSFFDKQPLLGDNYYRLVQIDIDGKENELETKVITFNLVKSKIDIYPNPILDKGVVGFEPNQYTNVKLLSPDGKLVKSWILTAGTSSLDVDLSGLPKGIYLIGLKGKTNWTFEKIVKN